MSVDEYLTVIEDMCRDYKIDPSIIKFALKQNLSEQFALHFSSSLETQKLTTNKIDLAKSFKYLRGVASDISLRKGPT